MRDISEIESYHAHVYFDAETVEAARELRADIEARFDIQMGRFHERPVGPHPRFSYQVAFAADLFGELVPWLTLNRRGLNVFVHTETGNVLEDHTENVMWLGSSEELNLGWFAAQA